MPSPTPPPALRRRRLLGRALALSGLPLLALAGCAAPFPEVPPGGGSSSALRHLRTCAEAQGLAEWRAARDLSLSLSGLAWPDARALPGPAAPGASLQLRLLPGMDLLALAEAVGGGRQLLRHQPVSGAGTLSLWAAGRPLPDAGPGSAEALAADLHRLLLLGCLAVADHPGPVDWAEPQTLDGRRCDHLHLALLPGPGGSAGDRLSLFIDRDQGLLRRLRVSLGGPGVEVLEVDLTGHRRLRGIVWPTRWLARSAGVLAGRDGRAWQLSGLDLNRGMHARELAAAPWTGAAAAPAAALPPG